MWTQSRNTNLLRLFLMLWSLNSNSFTDKNLSSLLTGEIKEWLCILSKGGLISFFSMKYWEYIFGHRGYKVQFIHWSNKHLLSPYKMPDISVQFSSVAQSCPTLCDPMNSSTPGLPVHDQLPESTQTHVHRVSDAIQPFHPLLSPSPPAPNPSQH